jgi:hypothetical protein
MNYLGNAIRIASVILGLTASMTSAFADQGSVPPGQLPALTAEWWQWVPRYRSLSMLAEIPWRLSTP